MSLLITHLFLSTLMFTMRLWGTSLGKEDTLAPLHRLILRPLSAPSNLCPFLWFPNPESQGNIAWFMTSLTPTDRIKTLSPPSIQISTHTISPVPGGHSQQCASLFTDSHLAPKPPFKMYLRPIVLYLSITDNGQAWWSVSRRKTVLWLISTTTSGLPQQGEHMACSWMREWTSCV